MPIANIIDRRANQYNVDCDIVVEPSCHDNCCNGTQFDWTDEFTVETLDNTTVAKAIEFASKWQCPTTLFIYDTGPKT